jgi:hypothetical protein
MRSQRHLWIPLLPLGVILARAPIAAAGQTAATAAGVDKPRVEIGVGAAELTGDLNSAAAGVEPRLTFNITRRTGIDMTASIVRESNADTYGPPERANTFLVAVKVKRALYDFGASTVFGTVGGEVATITRSYADYTYSYLGNVVVSPSRTTRHASGSFVMGFGVDWAVASRVALRTDVQLAAGADSPTLRASAGVTIPLGSYTAKPASRMAAAPGSPLSRIKFGQKVWVATNDGLEFAGDVVLLTSTTIGLRRHDGVTMLALAEVRRIDGTDPISDGVWKGALVGGAGMGVLGLIAGSELCDGGTCGGSVLAVGVVAAGVGAGLGALLGAVIDSFHEGRRVIYQPATTAVTLAPIVSPGRAGVSGSITWR